jgi:hypothetical protein
MLYCLGSDVVEFPVTVLIADVLCYVAMKYGIQQHGACLYWMCMQQRGKNIHSMWGNEDVKVLKSENFRVIIDALCKRIADTTAVALPSRKKL